ncbi:hypothetical protein J1605_007040 [Eschrichtius robustus]|uniref:Uncharacterized protein n=1 Tax=Eschrichtius robustus TaxID=9764 RepID=A0AB34H1X3_ESCRO|nr:hypothetical protein J1605_007040 [Eschrichtius robustus]
MGAADWTVLSEPSLLSLCSLGFPSSLETEQFLAVPVRGEGLGLTLGEVLSLGFYFDHDDVALEGVGPLLPRIGGTEVQRRPATFENAKPVLQLYLFQDVQKPSQDVCGKTQDASETAILREKTLDQAPFESACLFILFKPWK